MNHKPPITSSISPYAQKRARALHACIYVYQCGHGGVSPSYRELCDLGGHRSVSNVKRYLDFLVEMGLLLQPANQARSLVLLDDDGKEIYR